MPMIFNVYVILLLITISFQRPIYTLQEINEKFKSFVNFHISKEPIGLNISNTTYFELHNIAITYILKLQPMICSTLGLTTMTWTFYSYSNHKNSEVSSLYNNK